MNSNESMSAERAVKQLEDIFIELIMKMSNVGRDEAVKIRRRCINEQIESQFHQSMAENAP